VPSKRCISINDSEEELCTIYDSVDFKEPVLYMSPNGVVKEEIRPVRLITVYNEVDGQMTPEELILVLRITQTHFNEIINKPHRVETFEYQVSTSRQCFSRNRQSFVQRVIARMGESRTVYRVLMGRKRSWAKDL
ncbi:hypothetical protein ANN_04153, partial [Periplaneta americana]